MTYPKTVLHVLALLAVLHTAALGGVHGAKARGAGKSAPAATAPITAGAHISEHLYGLPGLHNMGLVASGIYRGAQPDAAGYKTLKRMGVRTVIDLRHKSDRQAVEAAGMKSLRFPMSSSEGVDPETVRVIVAAMTDPANKPVFVHCAAGKDRTGLVVAVYRMEEEGWEKKDALDEMKAYGFHEFLGQYKEYVRRYTVHNKGNGVRR